VRAKSRLLACPGARRALAVVGARH
jgi:hypothetical protein